MLTVVFTSKMERDVKRLTRRGKDMSKLNDVLEILAKQEPLPASYRDHKLKGEKSAYRECHIDPNWLLMYRIFENTLTLLAMRTGTHSDIFGE